MEQNPANLIHNHWHKIAAILMRQLGKTELEITPADIAALEVEEMTIVVDCRGGQFKIRLMSSELAEALRREVFGN